MSAHIKSLIVTEADRAIELKQPLILSDEVEAVRQYLETLGYQTVAEIKEKAALIVDAKREADGAAHAVLWKQAKIDKLKGDLTTMASADFVSDLIESAFATEIDNGMLHVMARDALESSLDDDYILTKLVEAFIHHLNTRVALKILPPP